MIDREARNKLAEAIRALSSGLISNDEFEDYRSPYSNTDDAIGEIYYKGAWSLYSDMQEYKLKGIHRLKPEEKTYAARLIMFLKTDLPYEWPISLGKEGITQTLLSILSLGFSQSFYNRKFKTYGEISVWPFIRVSDYENALKNPVYLNNAF